MTSCSYFGSTSKSCGALSISFGFISDLMCIKSTLRTIQSSNSVLNRTVRSVQALSSLQHCQSQIRHLAPARGYSQAVCIVEQLEGMSALLDGQMGLHSVCQKAVCHQQSWQQQLQKRPVRQQRRRQQRQLPGPRCCKQMTLQFNGASVA